MHPSETVVSASGQVRGASGQVRGGLWPSSGGPLAKFGGASFPLKKGSGQVRGPLAKFDSSRVRVRPKPLAKFPKYNLATWPEAPELGQRP